MEHFNLHSSEHLHKNYIYQITNTFFGDSSRKNNISQQIILKMIDLYRIIICIVSN